MNKPIPPVLAIVGSRNWPDPQRLFEYVAWAAYKGLKTVVSGGIGVVDNAAEEAAIKEGLAVVGFVPTRSYSVRFGHFGADWIYIRHYEYGRGYEDVEAEALPKRYPHFAAAAHARNSMIVNYCVEHGGGLTAFLDETVKSNGTRSTIEKAEKAGVLYEVITYKGAKA